jgi:hypothetical protein
MYENGSINVMFGHLATFFTLPVGTHIDIIVGTTIVILAIVVVIVKTWKRAIHKKRR